MVSRKRIFDQVVRGASDANISFQGVCTLLRSLGFEERIKASHHIFTRTDVAEILNLQPKGSKAKAYQIRQVRAVLVRYRLGGGSDEE